MPPLLPLQYARRRRSAGRRVPTRGLLPASPAAALAPVVHVVSPHRVPVVRGAGPRCAPYAPQCQPSARRVCFYMHSCVLRHVLVLVVVAAVRAAGTCRLLPRRRLRLLTVPAGRQPSPPHAANDCRPAASGFRCPCRSCALHTRASTPVMGQLCALCAACRARCRALSVAAARLWTLRPPASRPCVYGDDANSAFHRLARPPRLLALVPVRCLHLRCAP